MLAGGPNRLIERVEAVPVGRPGVIARGCREGAGEVGGGTDSERGRAAREAGALAAAAHCYRMQRVVTGVGLGDHDGDYGTGFDRTTCWGLALQGQRSGRADALDAALGMLARRWCRVAQRIGPVAVGEPRVRPRGRGEGAGVIRRSSYRERRWTG